LENWRRRDALEVFDKKRERRRTEGVAKGDDTMRRGRQSIREGNG
jgi:hypothetical protein